MRTYPYKAWVLTPSFNPVEVELVSQYGCWGSAADWDETAKGKCYNVERDLYPTKAAAVAEGRARIVKHRADITKRQTQIEKREAALDRAEGKS